jgi:hypothetical protein
MIEAFVAFTVFQTAPPIFPISVSHSRDKRMSPKREHVQRLELEADEDVPTALQWYNEAIKLIDQMLCCSYSGNQLYEEVAEFRPTRTIDQHSIPHDCASEADLQVDLVEETSPQQSRRSATSDQDAQRFVFLDSPAAKQPAKTKIEKRRAPRSFSTDSTASITSISSCGSWNTLPTNDSSLSGSHRSLPDSAMAPRPSEISIHKKRSASPFWTDPTFAEKENIRKVQSDIIADFPHLTSMTAAYQY